MRSLTIDEFKEKLDSILAKVPDEPRIGGPAGWISNSLLPRWPGGWRVGPTWSEGPTWSLSPI